MIFVIFSFSHSGDTAHYFNWVPGHFSNFVDHSVEDCVVFIPYKNGQWDDIPCGHTVTTHHHSHAVGEVHPVLCQYSKKSVLPIPVSYVLYITGEKYHLSHKILVVNNGSRNISSKSDC